MDPDEFDYETTEDLGDPEEVYNGPEGEDFLPEDE